MDASSAADLIRNEHPQIIATILVHLEPTSPAPSCPSPSLRNDVLLRIATLDGM
jgi:flagellar motor switch protein FliG